jgi:hypothetical protein
MDGEWDELNASDCVKGVCGDVELRNKWARYHLIRDVLKNEPVQADIQLVTRICAAIADEPAYSNITSIAIHPQVQAPVALTGETASDQSLAGSGRSGSGNSGSRFAVPRKDWLRTGMSGFALAASVAAVTVVGMDLWQQQQPAQGQSVASSNTAGSSSAGAFFASNTTGPLEYSPVFYRQNQGLRLPEVDLVANNGSFWVSPQSAHRVVDENRLNLFLTQHLESSLTADREGLLPYSRLVGYDERRQER